MSQQTPQHRNADWLQTLHGFRGSDGAPPLDSAGEPRFVPIGAPLGRSGQVFETNGGPGLGQLAVKLFTWAAGLPEQVVRDFTAEALTVANLRHRNVVRVLDAGTLADGTPFVVMERLAGMTLAEAAGGRPLRTSEALPILRGVASALAAAHAVGVAHGEVRADNVFLTERASVGAPSWGTPKLLDFGVARLAAGARAFGRGGPGAGAASEAVVRAPLELGRRAGERADQLALATLARELLGGRCTAGVERALARAASVDPRQRFRSVTALVDALEEAALNSVADGRAMSPAVDRTLFGPAVPIGSSHARVIVLPRGPAAAPPPGTGPVAGAPLAATFPSAPSSLTQQFFAEGEQLDAAHAAHRSSAGAEDAAGGSADQAETAAAAEADARANEENDLELDAPPRVPRSRSRMAATALLALGSVAVIGWTGFSLVTKPRSTSAPTYTPTPANRPGVAPLPPARARSVASSSAERPSVAGASSRPTRIAKPPSRRGPALEPPAFAEPAPANAPASTPAPALVAPRPWTGQAPPPPAPLPAEGPPSGAVPEAASPKAAVETAKADEAAPSDSPAPPAASDQAPTDRP